MRSVVAIAIGIVLAVPVTAAAKPRVALITFEGDPGGAARDVVGEVLGDDVMVLGSKQVNRTIDRLGLDTGDLGEKDLRKLSRDLEADAVIQAKLSHKGDHKLLHFKLFVHGKKQRGFKVEFASLKSKKFKSKLHDKMLEKLGADGGDEDPDGGGHKKSHDTDDALKTMKHKGEGGSGDDGDDDEVKPSHRDADADADTDSHAKKHKGDRDDDGSDGDEDKPRKAKKKVAHADDDDDSDSVSAHADIHPASAGRAANRAALRLDVGLSVQNRTLSFTARSYPQAPKTFRQSPVAGGRIAGELYPLAFGSPDGVAGGLGIGGMFDQTLVLNLQSSAQPGTKFPVTQRRYEIGLRFRLVFGHKPTSPSVTLGAGYMRRSFVVNRSALTTGNIIDLPDVDYAGFDPGVEFRIPVVDKVALVFGGQAILMRSAGPIQNLDQYGQAKVTGGSAEAGIDIVLGHHLAVGIRGEATQIGYAFVGNGDQTNNRDMDPTTKDIGGAADRYLGAAATIAILY